MTAPLRERLSTLRVLHIVNEVTDCSISSIIQSLVTHLDAERYNWHIGTVTELGNMTQTFRDLGVQVVDFKSGEGLPVATGRTTAKRMRSYVKQHRITIVHTHTLRARLLAAVALAGLGNPGHLDTVHHYYRPEDGRSGRFRTLVDRVSYTIPDHLVAVSRRMQEDIEASPFAASTRVTAIQNAVDCDTVYRPDLREVCRAEFGFAPDAPAVGYTGRILELKRLDILLEAFTRLLHRYPGARLLIVGEGEQRQELEALARTLGVAGSVTWTGFRQDIPRLLSAMDVFVLPSNNEGMSLSILEAMAAAKPVVVTDVGGARELVSDGETGILIQPGSVDEVHDAVAGLLVDPGAADRLARSARSSICARFGVPKMAAAYGEAYEELAVRIAGATEAVRES